MASPLSIKTFNHKIMNKRSFGNCTNAEVIGIDSKGSCQGHMGLLIFGSTQHDSLSGLDHLPLAAVLLDTAISEFQHYLTKLTLTLLLTITGLLVLGLKCASLVCIKVTQLHCFDTQMAHEPIL